MRQARQHEAMRLARALVPLIDEAIEAEGATLQRRAVDDARPCSTVAGAIL
jgi:hypothetical protein